MSKQAGGSNRSAAIPVATAVAKTGNLGVYLTALGTVTPVYTVTVISRVVGTLMSVHYREGQLVKKGDLLAEIDARPYQAVLTQAQGQTSQFLQWFTWPSKFWSVGPQVSETLLDGGARRGATEQAEAAYDGTVAAYRQTVLTAFQAVEDNLSSLRILNREVAQQHTAVSSATRYLDLAVVRFRTGVDSYLNVITAQTLVLTNRETEVQLQLRQMTSSVGLVMALGGGWNGTQLPTMKDLLARPPKWSPAGPMPALPAVTQPNPPPLPKPTANNSSSEGSLQAMPASVTSFGSSR